ncbi:MAG: potassium transporter TrkG [Candidatus Nitrosocosmicus sp.]
MVVGPLERSVLSYINHQFVILDEDQDAASSVKLMHDRKAETIIVKNNKNEYVGIITDSDILDKIVMSGEDSDKVAIKTIMSSPIITISVNATVKQALELMRLNVVKRIPVTDNIHILGIITQESLANAVRTSVLEKTFRPYRVIIREHYKPIMSNLGFILQFAAILFFGPAVLAAVLREATSAVGIFLCIISMLVTGFVLNSYGEKSPMNLKQASILIVSSFVLLSFFGSIPYMYVNPFGIDGRTDPVTLFINSFFESASGFTTTGLSFILLPEDLPTSFDLYRSFTQYVGGLSFVYLIIAFFYPERKLIHMRGIIGGGMLQVRQLVITIVIIFSIYAIVLIFFMNISGKMGFINSVSLIFSTVTGGGFIPTSTSLNQENVLEMSALMMGMIISALPFAFHYAVFSKELKTTKIRPEVFIYLGIISVSVFIFYLMIVSSMQNIHSSLMTSFFHVISAATNTGFQFINPAELSFGEKTLLIVLMLIGGAAFSTAGGFKITRLIYVFRKITGKKISPYSSVGSISSTTLQLNIRNQTLSSKTATIEEEKIFKESLYVIALFVVVSLIVGASISYLDGKGFYDSYFDSVSALTTTGLSTGVTSIDMNPLSKVLLILNMIVGRFEIITIIYLFMRLSKKRLHNKH